MLDLSHIPSQQQQTYTFYVNSSNTTVGWQTWNKPRGAKFLVVFLIGGGGAGGNGFVGTGNAGGGGGGGSSGYTRGIFPAFLLPDTLYIQVGQANPSNMNGVSSIALVPSNNAQTLLIQSSANAGGWAVSGVAGTVLAGGNGGQQGLATSATLSAFGNLGIFTSIAGVNGSAGGTITPTAGSNQAALGTGLFTGGAGGGGKTSISSATGGNITAATAILTNQVNGGSTDGANGDSGYGLFQPLCGTGGAGGAGKLGTTGAGGRGGNAWYGSGGGGGGAGSVSGGVGGRGGDGLVIITVIC